MGLKTKYKENLNGGNLVCFLDQLRVVFYQNNDGGLSYQPYKTVVAIKLLHNFTAFKLEDPHGCKEELKVKNNAKMAITGKFPNGTGLLEILLAKEQVSLYCNNYCGMTPEQWLI